jgi:hypothetical protein
MVAQAILYGLPPTIPPTKAKPEEARKWHDIATKAINGCQNQIKSRHLANIIEKYSDAV